jgi:hypothetical protein
MDALSTTILAGVIVAVVAAILAFIFNRIQEHRKQQRDLNERRAQAILEIRNRAASAGEALKGWAKRAGELHGLAVEAARHKSEHDRRRSAPLPAV